MKMLELQKKYCENTANLKILIENNENHENLRIPFENFEKS